MCCTYFKTIGHSLKNLDRSQKTYGHDMNCIHFCGAVFVHVGTILYGTILYGKLWHDFVRKIVFRYTCAVLWKLHG